MAARAGSSASAFCAPGSAPGSAPAARNCADHSPRMAASLPAARAAASSMSAAPTCSATANVRRIVAPLEFAPPRLEMIHPRHHRVCVAARTRRREFCTPHIVGLRLHVDLDSRRSSPAAPPAQHHAQSVVAVGEAMRFDGHRFARDALVGKAAAVDRRQDRIDDRAHPALGRRRGRWSAARL